MIDIVTPAVYGKDGGPKLQAAKGRCHCGAFIWLEYFTNTCGCGLEYNSAGQQLCSRESWGGETGEHPLDCV